MFVKKVQNYLNLIFNAITWHNFKNTKTPNEMIPCPPKPKPTYKTIFTLCASMDITQLVKATDCDNRPYNLSCNKLKYSCISLFV